jgi:regulator of cell morphogenesis and NO signaling
MMREHVSAEGLVAETRRLTAGFVPPAWACTTFVGFYGGLKQFESDLRQHVHVENAILFPRAIALESEQIRG